MKTGYPIRSPQDLGLLIAQARKSRGLSQRKLAAELGVGQAWLSRVERGYQKTWMGQVFRVAVYLGVEMYGQLETPDQGDRVEEQGSIYPDLDDLL